MSGVKPLDLINEIKKRPGIYNREALEQPRREHKHQLWLEVAERLTPAEDWESYTDVEKDARMDEIAGKWKHVRANFYRDVKLQESGGANKKRKYLYFDDMEFMRPYVGFKLPRLKRDKSLDSLDDSEDGKEEEEDNDTDIDLDALLKTSDNAEEDEAKVQTPSCRTRSKRVIKPTPKAMQNKPSTSTPAANRLKKESIIKNFDVLKKTGGTANPSFKIRDGDISFCLSLVPTLRKLGDGRKLRAKIEILKVLHRYVDHIERRNLVTKTNVPNHKNTNATQNPDVEEDLADDHSEECEESVNVKREKHDPLNGGSGNTKTWWT